MLKNLSLLLGAGFSIPLGAITIRNIPLKLENKLLQSLSKDSDEIKLFYATLEYLLRPKQFGDNVIKERFDNINKLLTEENNYKIKNQEIKIPLEELLSFIYCLRMFSLIQIKILTIYLHQLYYL